MRPLLFLLFAFAVPFPFFAQNNPAQTGWQPTDERIDLLPTTLFFADSTFKMTVLEILRQPMQPMPSRNWLDEQVGSARKKYWLLFSIKNTSPTDSAKLVFSPGRHARSEAFLLKNGEPVHSFGTAGWLNREPNRPWAANVFGLGIALAPGQRSEILVAVEDRYRFYDQLRSELYSPEKFTNQYHESRSRMVPLLFFMCLVIGGLGLLSLFVFAQFFHTGDRSLLWYCAYELVMVAIYAHGLHYYLVDFGRPAMPISFWNKAHALLQLMVMFLYVRFIFEFLNLRGHRGFGANGIRWTAIVSGGLVLFFLPFPFLFDKLPPAWTAVPFAVSYFMLTFAPPFVLICLLKIPGKLTIFPIVGTSLLMLAALTAVFFLMSSTPVPQHETGLFDTNRFYAGICILLEAVVFALGLGHKTRLLAVEKKAAQQKLLTLRANVSQDLHDDLGSEISSMSIFSYTAARSGDRERMASALENISAKSSKLVEDMRDIVWAMDPENDSMPKLADRMRAFAGQVFDEREVRLQFDFSPKTNDLKIQPEARKQVYLFYKEAMTNVSKHAHASTVFVKMGLDHGHFFLEIRDDGHGFPKGLPKNTTGGNGLGNLKKRAENLGGQLEIISMPEKGTTVLLRTAIS